MYKLINIQNKDIVSIVGSGGKTSLMYNIAKSISEKKVLVSTTTKIRIPDVNFYNYMALDEKTALDISNKNDNGIYVLANKFNDEKLESMELTILKNISQMFDLTILESDGSKEKLIKGWNDTEPVVVDTTTKTIGVVNIEVIGLLINEKNVHRVDRFLDITKAQKNDVLDTTHIVRMIMHENGLFKNARGQKVLFINAIENNSRLVLAKEIAEALRIEGFKLDYIIAGSIFEGVFFNL